MIHSTALFAFFSHRAEMPRDRLGGILSRALVDLHTPRDC